MMVVIQACQISDGGTPYVLQTCQYVTLNKKITFLQCSFFIENNFNIYSHFIAFSRPFMKYQFNNYQMTVFGLMANTSFHILNHFQNGQVIHRVHLLKWFNFILNILANAVEHFVNNDTIAANEPHRACLFLLTPVKF